MQAHPALCPVSIGRARPARPARIVKSPSLPVRLQRIQADERRGVAIRLLFAWNDITRLGGWQYKKWQPEIASRHSRSHSDARPRGRIRAEGGHDGSLQPNSHPDNNNSRYFSCADLSNHQADWAQRLVVPAFLPASVELDFSLDIRVCTLARR